MTHTFDRAERLKSLKTITRLFKEGRSFSCYPLRLVYLTSDVSDSTEIPAFPIQFALSVPKKNFKRAHDRNLLRRRVREAYRLHKHELYALLGKHLSGKNKNFAFMVLYVAKEELSYSEIERGIKKMIYKFGQELKAAAS